MLLSGPNGKGVEWAIDVLKNDKVNDVVGSIQSGEQNGNRVGQWRPRTKGKGRADIGCGVGRRDIFKSKPAPGCQGECCCGDENHQEGEEEVGG